MLVSCRPVFSVVLTSRQCADSGTAPRQHFRRILPRACFAALTKSSPQLPHATFREQQLGHAQWHCTRVHLELARRQSAQTK
ncbi:hypothetical protein V5799_025877 [Amblyomma americanum]|uniref:Uncharacterized protein n=1 Tax=Amblyomma americanum TaxID=6943 RepID=A0AAQ4E809_AMBAM